MVDVRPLDLDGVLEITPRRFADDRGFFTESWSREAFARIGLDHIFVQDNHSLTRAAGTLRGLHYQTPPFAQDKLVRVTRGAVFDVAVDIRVGSPTYRRWVGLTVSAAAGNQILVPAGFAHGFLTLEPDTEVQYKVTAPYSPAHDRAIRYDDPSIGIDWPVAVDVAAMSAKDRDAAMLDQQETGFAA